MLVMAISLLAVVVAFFVLIVSPTMNRAAEALFREHIERVAATRSESRGGAAPRRARQHPGPLRRAARIVGDARLDACRRPRLARDHIASSDTATTSCPRPTAARTSSRWVFRRHMVTVHNMLLALMLGIMIAVIVTTHLVLRRLLRPLRALGDGVARLSDGQLDVVLPNPTRDEFGALTDAFNQMVGRVRDMIRARDQLLLDVSHELRSPHHAPARRARAPARRSEPRAHEERPRGDGADDRRAARARAPARRPRRAARAAGPRRDRARVPGARDVVRAGDLRRPRRGEDAHRHPQPARERAEIRELTRRSI